MFGSNAGCCWYYCSNLLHYRVQKLDSAEGPQNWGKFWHLGAPIPSPFTDEGQIWCATTDPFYLLLMLMCQISSQSVYSVALRWRKTEKLPKQNRLLYSDAFTVKSNSVVHKCDGYTNNQRKHWRHKEVIKRKLIKKIQSKSSRWGQYPTWERKKKICEMSKFETSS